MEYRVAKVEDIEKVLELHFRYQVDSIKEEDKKDGFVTTAFTKEELTKLITKESGLFIGVKEGQGGFLGFLVKMADVCAHDKRFVKLNLLGSNP